MTKEEFFKFYNALYGRVDKVVDVELKFRKDEWVLKFVTAAGRYAGPIVHFRSKKRPDLQKFYDNSADFLRTIRNYQNGKQR